MSEPTVAPERLRDITERLKDRADTAYATDYEYEGEWDEESGVRGYDAELDHRAADEITRLRKQLADRDAQWERALHESIKAWDYIDDEDAPLIASQCRERLKEQGQ